MSDTQLIWNKDSVVSLPNTHWLHYSDALSLEEEKKDKKENLSCLFFGVQLLKSERGTGAVFDLVLCYQAERSAFVSWGH